MTTQNLHLMTLYLCFDQTEQTPNCSMFELLYVFKITEVFLVADIDSYVAFWKQTFKYLEWHEIAICH